MKSKNTVLDDFQHMDIERKNLKEYTVSSKNFIPLSVPNFSGNERRYADEAVTAGWVSTGGAFIKRMEGQLAAFLHAENVACCQSGTAALHLAIVDAGVGPQDIVLVPPLTFIAAVNPVRYQFAQPVFIDCDASFCMDPAKLRRFCAEECELRGDRLIDKATGKRVKAVVVVHVFGNLVDMEAIMDIAEEYHLAVIEDATEALGSHYTEGRFAGRYAGTIGDYGAYSFNGNKIITTGGGGAVTARDPQRVDHMRYLSTQAKDDPHYYIHHEIGYNYRMTNLQAAVGVAQMEELPAFLARKKENYEHYAELFADCPDAKLLPYRAGTEPNRWFYALAINRNRVKATMREIITTLEARGVGTRAIWGLINEQRPYEGERTYQLEQAPYYANRILNIPCSTSLMAEDVERAAAIIRRVLQELLGKRDG